jgi:molybdate transport system permease protein
MMPLVLPPAVTGYMLLSAFSPSGPMAFLNVAFSWWGAVVAAAAVGFPLLVLNITLAMKAVDPRLETISRSLGCTRWQTFWRVTFPLCRPGLIVGAILAFARGLGEFGATIVLAGRVPGKTETISLAMYRFLAEPDGTPKVVILSIVSVAICFAAVLASRSLEAWHRRRLEMER